MKGLFSSWIRQADGSFQVATFLAARHIVGTRYSAWQPWCFASVVLVATFSQLHRNLQHKDTTVTTACLVNWTDRCCHYNMIMLQLTQCS